MLWREKSLGRVRHRYYPDVSNIGLNFKITMTNMLKDPIKIMDSIQEQLWDFNRDENEKS